MCKKPYEGITIRSKKTQRVFNVLKQEGFSPDVRLLVKLIHSPKEEESSVHEPFWLEHDDWEQVDAGEYAASLLSPSALLEAAKEGQELGTCDED